MSTLTLILALMAPVQADKAAEEAADKAAEEAIEKFKGVYKPSATTAERTAAVADLARLQHEKVLRRLGNLLVTDDRGIRIAAAKGLAEYKEIKKQATAALVNAIGPNMTMKDVISALFDAIGKLGEESGLANLPRFFEEKDVDIAKSSIRGAGESKKRMMIEPIMAVMRENDDIMDGGNKKKKTGGVPGANTPGTGGGGGFGGLPNVGDGNDDAKKKKLDRAKGIVDACVKAMQSITTEKWSTREEWDIWWNRNKSKFQIGSK